MIVGVSKALTLPAPAKWELGIGSAQFFSVKGYACGRVEGFYGATPKGRRLYHGMLRTGIGSYKQIDGDPFASMNDAALAVEQAYVRAKLEGEIDENY